MLQVVSAGQGFMADRYTYIPYIGLFFILGVAFDHLLKKSQWNKILVYSFTALYLLVLSWLSFKQCDVWQNSETLWTQIIEKYPRKVKEAHVNRGNYYRAKGKNKEAILDYNEALAADPKFLKAYNNRAVAYINSDSLKEALADVNFVLTQDPGYRKAYINRAAVFLNKGEYQKAISDYDKSLALNPNTPRIYYLRGHSKLQIKRYREALEDLNIAIKFDSNNGNYYNIRSYTYKALGKTQQALQDVLRARKMGIKVSQKHLDSLQK